LAIFHTVRNQFYATNKSDHYIHQAVMGAAIWHLYRIASCLAPFWTSTFSA